MNFFSEQTKPGMIQMNPKAMELHGIALMDYFNGDKNATLTIHRDDGHESTLPVHVFFLEANRKAGRYIGEIRMQFEYRGRTSPYCGWLHVDAETLREHAIKKGWNCDVIIQDQADYLARLTK